jgi:CHAT domain-containing protein
LRLQDTLQTDTLSRTIFIYQEKIDNLFDRYHQKHPVQPIGGDYVEYSLYGNDIYILSAIASDLQLIKLGSRDSLRLLMELLNHFIRSRGLEEDVGIQQELYKFLLGPVMSHWPQRLVIIPDAEIGYIPFDVLVDLQGATGFAECIISYSSTYHMVKEADKVSDAIFDLYCLAPTYENASEQDGPERDERGTLYPLLHAQAEVDSIQRLFQGRVHRSLAKTDKVILDSLAFARIFHFAGHAIVNRNEAYLAIGHDQNPASTLTTSELSLLAQGPELVVLSACETGLGKLETGEGISSLGRSFLEAGARAVVISLWNVNDRSTSSIMTAFYRHLKTGDSVDEALRNAKLEYISKSEPEARHPYFWAGFVVFGELRL